MNHGVLDEEYDEADGMTLTWFLFLLFFLRRRQTAMQRTAIGMQTARVK